MRKNVFRSGEAINNPPGFARYPRRSSEARRENRRIQRRKMLGTGVGIVLNPGKEEWREIEGRGGKIEAEKRIPVRGGD